MKTHYDRIEINPDVMLGKPVIRGTRIPVELIIRKLGEGAVLEDLLDAYPNLVKDDIQAALLYAADHTRTRCSGSAGAAAEQPRNRRKIVHFNNNRQRTPSEHLREAHCQETS